MRAAQRRHLALDRRTATRTRHRPTAAGRRPVKRAGSGSRRGKPAQALSRELQEAQSAKPGGANSGTRAFALGQNPRRQDGRFDARQRAMLQAVPDDPGALLRRKFRLEWEQRRGQGQEDPRR
jgi:hypothetical protein